MSVPVTVPNRDRAMLLEREPIRLLDVDPDLGAALAPERRAPAERALVVSTCCPPEAAASIAFVPGPERE